MVQTSAELAEALNCSIAEPTQSLLAGGKYTTASHTNIRERFQAIRQAQAEQAGQVTPIQKRRK